MNPATFTSLNLFLTSVLIILLTVVIVKSKAPTASKCILITLMCFQLYSHTITHIGISGYWQSLWPWFYRSAYPLELSSPPLVYLYMLSLTRPQLHWKDIHWYHAIPFMIGLVWYLFGPPLSAHYNYDKYLRTLVAFFVIAFYLWQSRKVIQAFERQGKNQRSNLADLRLPWLRFLLGVCYAATLLTFFDLLTGPEIPLWLYRSSITNIALIGLTYYGLKASEFFVAESKVTSAPPLNREESAALSQALMQRLKDQQLFLKPQIRLADIAKELGVKSYKLSEAINQGLNTNFYDLINGMRIEHAKNLLRDPQKDHLNLLGIALDSGFNSKSVFNDHFRRITGLTPSDFRLQR